MYYELYIDSLFLIDFIMNLLTLCLTNKMQGRTATRTRCIAGAACAAGIYCTIFIIPVLSLYVRLIIGFAVSVLAMSSVTFKCKTLRQILRIASPMAGAMLFAGGFFLLFKEKIFEMGEVIGNVTGTALTGIAAYALGTVIVAGLRKKSQTVCSVILETEYNKITVSALIDTGNFLIEPISKKPVSVLDEESIKLLFKGKLPVYYRVVPYTSIGKKKGMLRCFEIPRVIIKTDEEEKNYENVLIACGDGFRANEGCMILNPRLMCNKEE